MLKLVYPFIIFTFITSCSLLEQYDIDVFDENINLAPVSSIIPSQSFKDAIFVLQTALDNSDNEAIKQLGYEFGDDVQIGFVIHKDSIYSQIGKDRSGAFLGRLNDPKSGIGVTELVGGKTLLVSTNRNLSLENRWVFFWSGNRLAKRSPSSSDGKPIFFDFAKNFVLVDVPTEVFGERIKNDLLTVSFGLD